MIITKSDYIVMSCSVPSEATVCVRRVPAPASVPRRALLPRLPVRAVQLLSMRPDEVTTPYFHLTTPSLNKSSCYWPSTSVIHLIGASRYTR